MSNHRQSRKEQARKRQKLERQERGIPSAHCLPGATGEPPPKRQKIWRYMDLAKLLSMLQSEKLYLPSLVELEDPFEGFLPDWQAEQMRQSLPTEQRDLKILEQLIHGYRGACHVSCWHENEGESAAMWRLYLRSNEGIAIQSTIGRLRRALRKYQNDFTIGRVNYVDYDVEPLRAALLGRVGSPGADGLALFKRHSFAHEREVRVVVFLNEDVASKMIPIHLATLVEKIYVAPQCPAWFRTMVELVIQKYGLKVPVVHSALDARPRY